MILMLFIQDKGMVRQWVKLKNVETDLRNILKVDYENTNTLNALVTA